MVCRSPSGYVPIIPMAITPFSISPTDKETAPSVWVCKTIHYIPMFVLLLLQERLRSLLILHLLPILIQLLWEPDILTDTLEVLPFPETENEWCF